MVITLSEGMLKTLHSAVLRRYPKDTLPGYMSESMILGCMDFAMTYVYGYEPYPDVISKAGALLHSIVTFHPFMDGNKRTALLATYFFLHFNGYVFRVTEEAVQFTRQIASGDVKEVRTVVKWLFRHATRHWITVLFHKLFYSRFEERELTIMCITMLREISDLLKPFERYKKASA